MFIFVCVLYLHICAKTLLSKLFIKVHFLTLELSDSLTLPFSCFTLDAEEFMCMLLAVSSLTPGVRSFTESLEYKLTFVV